MNSPRLRLVCACVLLFVARHASAEWFSDQQGIMGTAISIQLWHEDPAQGRAAIAAVMAEMQRIDEALSPYKESSELSRVNREASAHPVEVSIELALIIDKALFYSRASEGAFDISFASVGRFYDYRQQRQPDAEQRARLLPAIDYRLIEFDKAKRLINFRHPQLQIDLGGIAKGYAVDRGIAILRGFGVHHATLSAGGDSRVLGDKRGQPWLVGVRNPRKDGDQADRVAITIPLVDAAISTSGDYERFFIDADSGERVHHILNPRTGRSVEGFTSVSIIGAEGFDTDPLSTTVFVLGIERGLALVDRLPGFDCVIIDAAGRVHYSRGLMPPTAP